MCAAPSADCECCAGAPSVAPTAEAPEKASADAAEAPEKPSAAQTRCAACGAVGVKTRCGACRGPSYCGADCQRAHWKEHKLRCAKTTAAPRPTFGGPLALDAFVSALPACAVCGRDAVAWDGMRGPWDGDYRSCCGSHRCERCEFGGKKKEGPVPASTDKCVKCGAAAAAGDGKALARAKARADEGRRDAMYALGVTYLRALRGRRANVAFGHKMLRRVVIDDDFDKATLDPDHLSAAAWYELACAKRDGLLEAARCPEGVPLLLRRAAARGHARALYELGATFEKGGEHVDRREAARLTALAAEAGVLAAKKALARYCIDGEGVDRDPERAARLLGLDRTADMWKNGGTGPQAPSFLFAAPVPDAGGVPDAPIPTDEYDEKEMDAFFDGYETDDGSVTVDGPGV